MDYYDTKDLRATAISEVVDSNSTAHSIRTVGKLKTKHLQEPKKEWCKLQIESNQNGQNPLHPVR